MHYCLTAVQDGGEDQYYWICHLCNYRSAMSCTPIHEDFSCPDCQDGKAARRERQRLAWIQFMCANHELHGDSHEQARVSDDDLKMYNERWETDDQA